MKGDLFLILLDVGALTGIGYLFRWLDRRGVKPPQQLDLPLPAAIQPTCWCGYRRGHGGGHSG